MDFFNRFRKNNPKPVMPTIGNDRSARIYRLKNIDRRVSYGLGAVLVILVLLFGGRWLHHYIDTHSHKTQLTPTVTKPLPHPDGTTSSTPSSNSGNKSSASGSTTPNPSTPATTPSTNGQIPNTGPGDVLAIFAASAFAAASLHYVLRLRQNQR